MLIEEANVSLTMVKTFMIDGRFLMAIENYSISGGRILMDETLEKQLIERDRRGIRNSPGDREDVNMTKENYLHTVSEIYFKR